MMLGCGALPHLHAPPESSRSIASLDWSHCPLDLLDCPQMSTVLQLDRLSRVSPLAGWPERYAAWVVAGIMAVREYRGVS